MNGNEFLGKWIRFFAPDITKSQYNKRIRNQYIWHAFSWKIIPKGTYFEGDEARKAYNGADKEDAMCFQFWRDEFPVPLSEEFDLAEKIETPDGDYDEFYVVGKDFKWTYIVTHETDMGFGPYFMSLK